MVHYKLYYFNLRARGEIARLVFAAAGQEYEDFRLEKEEWTNHKDKMPFHQLPVLEVTDGSNVTQIAQSIAIARYLANEFNLAGKSALEKAKVDMIADQWLDLQNAMARAHFESDEAKKKEMQEKLFTETIPQNFEFFEKILKTNGTGYFVGDGLTWVDLFAMNLLDWVKGKIEPVLEKFPSLSEHNQKIRSLPKIAEWLEKRPVTDM